MKARIVEVYTPGGRFLLSQRDDRVVCEGWGKAGLQQFAALSELPEHAKRPVFDASCKLSHKPHKFIFRSN